MPRHRKIPKVEINLNPFQGLKRDLTRARRDDVAVEINLNPFQGLKLKRFNNYLCHRYR